MWGCGGGNTTLALLAPPLGPGWEWEKRKLMLLTGSDGGQNYKFRGWLVGRWVLASLARKSDVSVVEATCFVCRRSIRRLDRFAHWQEGDDGTA